MKLRDIGEFGFIDRIAPVCKIRSRGVVKGIGDDCAVIQQEGDNYLLVTTDLLVERVHFLMDMAGAEVIGAKALAVNLSDIAACGGTPLDAFVSLAVPERVQVEWLEGFYRGMTKLAAEYEVNLLGGDTTGSKQDLVINVALTGTVRKDEILFRHTAGAGDIVAITGPLGESNMGLRLLLGAAQVAEEVRKPLVKAHLEPRPHIKEGRSLAASGSCAAAIDLSDGISSDLRRICESSGVGATLHEDRIPVSEPLRSACQTLGLDPLDIVLSGGEDYALLVAVRADKLETLKHTAESEGWELYPIGEFTPDRTLRVARSDGVATELSSTGWDHFR